MLSHPRLKSWMSAIHGGGSIRIGRAGSVPAPNSARVTSLEAADVCRGPFHFCAKYPYYRARLLFEKPPNNTPSNPSHGHTSHDQDNSIAMEEDRHENARNQQFSYQSSLLQFLLTAHPRLLPRSHKRPLGPCLEYHDSTPGRLVRQEDRVAQGQSLCQALHYISDGALSGDTDRVLTHPPGRAGGFSGFCASGFHRVPRKFCSCAVFAWLRAFLCWIAYLGTMFK